ncbi:CAP domain-containing protein [Georgenia sp. 10Sc9-8]|uniref:CAP domain-containing protein n=1 Tax=Georgenia halotolerans TaxID=3028317 RepID=A0ABT5TYD4_9MICO|nr:CAP domain-containing protein [Georgenia halotolerans]
MRERLDVRRWIGRRPLVGSSVAAVLLVTGGATAVALTPAQQDDSQDPQALAVVSRLEAGPGTGADERPALSVPETGEWSLPTPAVSAEAPPAPEPREAPAASRSAERAPVDDATPAQPAAQEQQAGDAAERRAVEEQVAEERAAEEQAVEHQVERRAERPAESSTSASASDGSERGALTSMLNSYRAANGLAPLSRDGALDSAAQQWAQWMAQNQSLQHSDYVNGAVQRGNGWSRGSEIIVRYRGGGSLPTGEILSFMHSWWQGSPVHNANMLKSGFTHVGTGYAMGPGGPYAVHIFGG